MCHNGPGRLVSEKVAGGIDFMAQAGLTLLCLSVGKNIQSEIIIFPHCFSGADAKSH